MEVSSVWFFLHFLIKENHIYCACSSSNVSTAQILPQIVLKDGKIANCYYIIMNRNEFVLLVY